MKHQLTAIQKSVLEHIKAESSSAVKERDDLELLEKHRVIQRIYERLGGRDELSYSDWEITSKGFIAINVGCYGN